MQHFSFVYDEHVSDYEFTKNQDDVVSMKDNYLEWIKEYRKKGYRIFYQDETWVFKDMTCKKVWHDKTASTNETTIKVPSSSGERSILSLIISEEDGLLENCMVSYRGKKANKSEDYHTKMNWDVFSNWCERKVFPSIAYKFPNTEWSSEWSSKKEKSQMLEYAKSIYPLPNFQIPKMADLFSKECIEIKVLFLPVAHPELNCIEMD